MVWLVQGNCTIGGDINISGGYGTSGLGAAGGPGGYSGGSGSSNPTPGQGPGGGSAGVVTSSYAPNASFGTLGFYDTQQSGPLYGNIFCLPLLGGSGGGGSWDYGWPGVAGGGGGGGAILIASSGQIQLNGGINANGGGGRYIYNGGVAGGCGSGGSVRLVASELTGTGSIGASGGQTGSQNQSRGGSGRVRFDALLINFGGRTSGVYSQGFQPIILPAAGQSIQLSIASIAGNTVSANPSGVLVNPDVIIPAQQSNPIPIIINCTNIPLNTEISVIVHPANGPDVQAVATNNAGTLAASSATVSLNMPRGGGIIYAKCVSGLAGLGADNSSKELRTKSLAETGWTADGERFAKVEVTASLGGQQQIAYITESGKRYPLAAR